MCTIAIETLTLDTLLSDPLTRLLMRRDGVSEDDFAALWARIGGRRETGADSRALAPA